MSLSLLYQHRIVPSDVFSGWVSFGGPLCPTSPQLLFHTCTSVQTDSSCAVFIALAYLFLIIFIILYSLSCLKPNPDIVGQWFYLKSDPNDPKVVVLLLWGSCDFSGRNFYSVWMSSWPLLGRKAWSDFCMPTDEPGQDIISFDSFGSRLLFIPM